MSKLTYYTTAVHIERNGRTRVYMSCQISWASTRRLWAIRDKCVERHTERFYTSYVWK